MNMDTIPIGEAQVQMQSPWGVLVQIEVRR